MPMRLFFYALVSLFLIAHLVQSQDPHFSQYDAAPLHLNPAYAGYVQDARANICYRNQWRDLGSYNTFSASVDIGRACGERMMGGGMYVMHDSQNANVQTLTGGIVLVPGVLSNKEKTLSARGGVYVGGGQRTYHAGQRTFMDQLNGQATVDPTRDPLAVMPLTKSFLDVGFGGLMEFNYSDSDQDWIGVSVYHLNQPDVAVGQEKYRLPMRIGVQMGSKLRAGLWNVTPVANFRVQSRIYQLDFGSYFQYSSLTLGLLYRGLPLSRSLVNQITQDAVVGVVSLQSEQFSFGFSYDITISKLKSYSGNAFEFTLRYILADSFLSCQNDGKRSKFSGKKAVRCPMYKSF